MKKFTKTYNVQPNDKQRESLVRAYKNLCEYFLNEENANVEVVVKQFDEKRIIANLIVNNAMFEQKIIGINGGITTC